MRLRVWFRFPTGAAVRTLPAAGSTEAGDAVPRRRRESKPERLTLAVWALLCCAAGGHAAEVRLGNVVPEAGLIRKPVVSMRERRYLDLIPQQTDFSCGAAALATILRYSYGRDVDEVTVLKGLLAVSDAEVVRARGFSLLDIKRYAKSIGFRGRGYRASLDALQRVRIPSIALLNIRGYKHFVVLKKTTHQYAYLADPALGNRIMPLDEFAKAWSGVIFAMIGPGFDRHSVLLSPAPPLTAREEGAFWLPLADAELLDFGFTHADLLH